MVCSLTRWTNFSESSARVLRNRSQPIESPIVLIADDDLTIHRILEFILNQAGFEVTSVFNGRQALDAAVTIRPDIPGLGPDDARYGWDGGNGGLGRRRTSQAHTGYHAYKCGGALHTLRRKFLQV